MAEACAGVTARSPKLREFLGGISIIDLWPFSLTLPERGRQGDWPTAGAHGRRKGNGNRVGLGVVGHHRRRMKHGIERRAVAFYYKFDC